VKMKVNFRLKSTTAILTTICALIVILFGFSIYYNLAADYKNIQATYMSLLKSDLCRYLALFILSLSVGTLVWNKYKVNKQINGGFTIIIIILAIMYFVHSARELYPTINDLAAKRPLEIEGVLIYKEESRPKGRVKYYIDLDTVHEHFTVIGNNAKNGYEAAEEGDYVKVWYGKKSQKVYFIKVIKPQVKEIK